MRGETKRSPGLGTHYTGLDADNEQNTRYERDGTSLRRKQSLGGCYSGWSPRCSLLRRQLLAIFSLSLSLSSSKEVFRL